MKPVDYWHKRSEQIAARQFQKADAYEQALRKEYARATASIKRDIESFYQRFAVNNEISLVEAKKLLTAGELKEFKMTLENFIAKAKNNADGQWTKQLNNVYYRTRVSRLEALQTQIRQQVELLAGSRQSGTKAVLGDVFTDTYYRTMHEIQAGTGVGVSFAKVDSAGLEKVLGTKFAGSNWSQRIWGDRTKLATELQTKLSQALIRGDSYDKTTQALAERFGVSYSNSQRLVQTESAFFTEQATFDSYKASGVVDQYEILATLDSRTSDICRGMDGKKFAVSEMEVGVNAPPFHSRCRTTTVPYFDDEEDVGERIARDEDRTVYYVPGDITYEEWKKQYVDSPSPPESAIINNKTYRTFEAPEQVNEWEHLVTPDWLQSLTVQEADAIKTYTGSAYSDINRNLRQNLKDTKLEELADLIRSGIQKFNLRENVTVFRGMDDNIFGDVADLPGLRFREKGFWSTSMLEEKKFTGAVEMEFRVPAKSRGAPVNVLSQYQDEEYEFLLDAGLEYQIIEATELNGKLKLIIEVIQDAD